MEDAKEIAAQRRGPGSLDRFPINSSSREAVVLTVTGALLLFIMTQPAFKSFFFGENFLYLGQYRAHDNNFWRAVLGPSDNIFFRPIFCACSLPWYFVLPLDPLAYHLRNFAFSVINMLLLHRVLVRLVMLRYARVLAFFFFVISKIHLTTIGYINIYDSILMLLLLLLTILFFLRYVDNGRWLDYALGLFFSFLSVFSKDYGLVVVIVVIGVVITRCVKHEEWMAQIKYWSLRLSPLPLIVAAYLVLRHSVVGLVPSSSSNAIYSPQLSFDLSLRKLLILTSTIWNLSFFNDGTTGALGLSSFTQVIFGFNANVAEVVLYGVLMLFLISTVVKGLRSRRLLLFPLIWVAVYFGPTLFTRNIQMYYMYEPLAGIAVLLGVCLGQATRRSHIIWTVVLLVIGVNGLISNYTSTYHWQHVANAASSIQEPVLKAHRGEPIESITFITSSQPFWQYVLGADLKGPMLQELMRLPRLQVRVIEPNELGIRRIDVNAINLIYDIDRGFEPYDYHMAQSSSHETGSHLLTLNALSPSRTQAGQPFNIQPNGQSALSVDCEGATPETVIMLDNLSLLTTYGSPRWLTALVSDELYATTGQHQIYIKNKMGESNRLEFVVESSK